MAGSPDTPAFPRRRWLLSSQPENEEKEGEAYQDPQQGERAASAGIQIGFHKFFHAKTN
jgi:hypothetical protein